MLHLQEVSAFQHHTEPALQQQDPVQDLTMQPLLQGLPLCLLQEDLWAGAEVGTCGLQSLSRRGHAASYPSQE